MPPKKSRNKSKIKSKKAFTKKAGSKKLARPKKTPLKRKAAPKKRRARGKRQNVGTVTFEPRGLGANSGGQSGDLQGLSDSASADSESVDELLETASKRVDRLGIATVYRTVGALLDAGRIEAVEIPGEPTRYERADKGLGLGVRFERRFAHRGRDDRFAAIIGDEPGHFGGAAAFV